MFIPFTELKAAFPELKKQKRFTLILENGATFCRVVPVSIPNTVINNALNIEFVTSNNESSRCIAVLIED